MIEIVVEIKKNQVFSSSEKWNDRHLVIMKQLFYDVSNFMSFNSLSGKYCFLYG